MRNYHFNSLAGCVTQAVNRQTGLLVGLYATDQAGMGCVEDGDGPWVTVCEEHGQLVTHATLSLARSHLRDPMGWCEVCNGAEVDE